MESSGSLETLGHGRSRGTSFIHLGFVVAEILGFKIGTFIIKHAVYDKISSECKCGTSGNQSVFGIVYCILCSVNTETGACQRVTGGGKGKNY